jgi:sensor c-di-GMP phosphodiesterase-like protein
MRMARRQVFVTLSAVAVAMLCGVIATLLVVTAIALKSANSKLEKDAVQMLNTLNGVLDEARLLVATMNASHDPACSDDEIAFLRKMIYSSENFRDAGHIHSGRIECSAMLGRDHLPSTQFHSVADFKDGISIFKNLSPYQSNSRQAFGLQMDDLYVVLDPRFSPRMDQINPNRIVTMIDSHSGQAFHPGRPLPAIGGLIDDHDWQARLGNTLFVTRCNLRSLNCVTTYATIRQMLDSRRGDLAISIPLGALFGAPFGLIFSLLYKRNRSMVQQLRRAIRRDELQVVYQPIVCLASKHIVGAEALVRWTDEEGFAVGPNVFVRLAEERGFVGGITRLVLHKSLRDFEDILRSKSGFHLSVNVTAADLADPRFLPTLDHSLEVASVAAGSLSIEITESGTARSRVAMDAILRLRDRGHKVVIDDFGTGYSSLAYLQDLAVDAIKIDKAFTKAVGTEAVTANILPQILAMAEVLNLAVVVEGIETAAQADYFSGAGERILAQGWFFGRPVSAEAFHRLLAQDERKVPVTVDAATAPANALGKPSCSLTYSD